MVSDAASTALEVDVVDEARFGAAGTRKTARWIASGLGALPSIAILTSIVRAPSDSGFDGALLGWGIALATTGALVGIYGFANVLAPVPLRDPELQAFDLSQVPGSPHSAFGDLLASIEDLRVAIADKEQDAARARAESKIAHDLAARATADVKATAEIAAMPNSDESAQALARAAREKAEQLRGAADDTARTAERESGDLAILTAQFGRLQDVRKNAYLLRAAEVVASRYSNALAAGAAATVLVAGGLWMLGMAPVAEHEGQAAPTLVKVTLNKLGQAALGCEGTTTLSALQVGGEPSTPKLITLPTDDCPAQTLSFPASTPSPLGSVEPADEIEISD